MTPSNLTGAIAEAMKTFQITPARRFKIVVTKVGEKSR
jgi:hypothetical protein